MDITLTERQRMLRAARSDILSASRQVMLSGVKDLAPALAPGEAR